MSILKPGLWFILDSYISLCLGSEFICNLLMKFYLTVITGVGWALILSKWTVLFFNSELFGVYFRSGVLAGDFGDLTFGENRGTLKVYFSDFLSSFSASLAVAYFLSSLSLSSYSIFDY